MKCCKASQFSNDAGARIWQAADVGYLALQYGAWLTWACLTLQLSSHLVPLLLQESSLHFLSFFVKTFLVYFNNLCTKPVDRGGSVGSDEPPRLPNGPLEVFKNYYTGYF